MLTLDQTTTAKITLPSTTVPHKPLQGQFKPIHKSVNILWVSFTEFWSFKELLLYTTETTINRHPSTSPAAFMSLKWTLWSNDSWPKVRNLMPCPNSAKVHGSGQFFVLHEGTVVKNEWTKMKGTLVSSHVWRDFPFNTLSFLFIPYMNHNTLHFLTISSLTRMQPWNQTGVTLNICRRQHYHLQIQTLAKLRIQVIHDFG